MSLWAFVVAAVLLSLERVCYIWAWRAPDSFRAFCARPGVMALGDPVSVLQKLFFCFKGIQLAVFFGWCYLHGYGLLPSLMSRDFVVLAIGTAVIIAGQFLNFSVFYRLGKIGVFYGTKFGYVVPWCRAFPFSFLAHPQYVGAVFSIWGFFFTVGFPHDNWYLLPALQTIYYLAGAYFESQ